MCIYGCQLAIFRRQSYEATTTDLWSTTEALVASPFSPSLQVRVVELRHKKKITDNYAARGVQIKARLHWLKVGDHASKEYFLALRARRSSPGIKKFKDPWYSGAL